MKKNSLFTSVIHEEVSKLEKDIEKIDLEILELQEQYIDFDNKYYQSSMRAKIEQNKLAALIGAKKMIEDEIDLYQASFTDDMIADLDYILEEYCTIAPRGRAYMIISARIDIVRFERSDISGKDYKRDTKAIFKKVDEVSPFLNLHPNVRLPELPHQIIKQLIHFLTEADTKRLGFLKASEERALSQEAIKSIVDTISSLKILPRGQDNFDDMWTEFIYGDITLPNPFK